MIYGLITSGPYKGRFLQKENGKLALFKGGNLDLYNIITQGDVMNAAENGAEISFKGSEHFIFAGNPARHKRHRHPHPYRRRIQPSFSIARSCAPDHTA